MPSVVLSSRNRMPAGADDDAVWEAWFGAAAVVGVVVAQAEPTAQLGHQALQLGLGHDAASPWRV